MFLNEIAPQQGHKVFSDTLRGAKGEIKLDMIFVTFAENPRDQNDAFLFLYR